MKHFEPAKVNTQVVFMYTCSLAVSVVKTSVCYIFREEFIGVEYYSQTSRAFEDFATDQDKIQDEDLEGDRGFEDLCLSPPMCGSDG